MGVDDKPGVLADITHFFKKKENINKKYVSIR